MIFYAKHRLTQKLCFTQTQCFTQIYVLARPVQALLAASRIAMTVMTMMMMMMTMTMMSRRTTVTRVTMVMSVMMAMMTIMTVITMMTTMLLVEIDSYSTFTFVGKICSRIMWHDFSQRRDDQKGNMTAICGNMTATCGKSGSISMPKTMFNNYLLIICCWTVDPTMEKPEIILERIQNSLMRHLAPTQLPAWNNYFLQHAENRVHASVFARWCLKIAVNNYRGFCYQWQKHRKHCAQNISIYSAICAQNLHKLENRANMTPAF